MPFASLPDGRLSDQFTVHISNKNSEENSYRAAVAGRGDVEVILPGAPVRVAGGEMITLPLFFNFPLSSLDHGKTEVEAIIVDKNGRQSITHLTLLGPEHPSAADGAVPAKEH